MLNLGKRQLGHLNNECHQAVHDCAHGCKVVEGYEGIHLELGAGEETLDHDEARGLEDDTSDLEEEASHVELNLAVGCNDHTNDNEGNIAECLEVWWCDSKDPRSDEHSNRCGGFEHLNEGDGEVEVGQVTADQRQREHEANGYNGSKIDSAGHGDLLARVQHVGCPRQDLGHERGKGEMPCCEEDWVVEPSGVQNPFVEDDECGRDGNPGHDVDCGMQT